MANDKNTTSWVFLGAAVLAGALAFWLSHSYLKNQEEKIRTEAEGAGRTTVQVLVARRDVAAGAIVSPDTMDLAKLPAEFVTNRFVTGANLNKVIGHVLIRSKPANEPLMLDDVGGAFVERLSDLVKPGERAITVSASDLNSDSGLLLPGDYVDFFVLTSPASGGDEDKHTIMPVLENVHVLAAGPQALKGQDQKYQPLDQRGAHYDAVTVAVKVEDAEKLVLAAKMGDLAFLLRNSRDLAPEVAGRMTSDQLGSGVQAASTEGGGLAYQYYSGAVPAGAVRTAVAPSIAQGPARTSAAVPPAPVSPMAAPAWSTAPAAPPPQAAPAGGQQSGEGGLKPSGEQNAATPAGAPKKSGSTRE